MAKASAVVNETDEAAVRELFSRFNRKEDFFADPQATWIDEPHYRVPSQNLEMRTRAEVVDWFRATLDAIPDLHMEVEEVVMAGEPGHERVTVRWRITGTHSGAPWQGIDPTGRAIDLRGMDLLEMQDGRIAGNNVYLDQLTFVRQIGMLPSEGSTADRLGTGAFNLATKTRATVRDRARR